MYTSTTQMSPEAFCAVIVYRASQPTGDGTGLPLEADEDFAPPADDEKVEDEADTKEKSSS
jgi:hypothetical protein